MAILHWIVKLIVKCITDCFIFWGVDLYYVWKYQIAFILSLNVLLFVLEEQIFNICSVFPEEVEYEWLLFTL
jgi:hypothetical protein